MTKKPFLIIFAAAALSLASRADAQVLTFDETSPTANTILGTIECVANGQGFRLSASHFHLTGVGTLIEFQGFSSNDTPHVGYESGRGAPFTLERVGGGTFSLLSLDAAEFYAAAVVDRPDAQVLTLTGHQAGGGVVSHTISLDGIRDGVGGVADFEHFTLPGTFVNLTSVVFTGLQLNGDPGGVTVDNLAYVFETPGAIGPCVASGAPQTAPQVTITSPAPGNVSGVVSVAATATDDIGVLGVQFKLDGQPLGAEDTTAPYEVSWNSATVVDGNYVLTAEARDIDANVGVASVGVNVVNSPVPPQAPYYLDLDGVNDYVDTPDAPALSFGTGVADSPFTVEFWMRPDAMGTKQQVIGKWGDTPTQEYRVAILGGVVRVEMRDASANATVGAYSATSQLGLAGAWHHVAVTYDGRGGATAANGLTIYIDGVSIALTRLNSAAYVAMENLTGNVQIGRESNGWRQFNGSLDEIRLWNVARTVTQVQANRNIELTGAESGLVAYWTFNEATGTTSDDRSLNNHVATLYNGTARVSGGPFTAPDTTAPVISAIAVSGVTSTSATVTFTTDETATGAVTYNLTGACPCTEVTGAAAGLAHSINLTGLMPNTVYHYAAKATDSAGNIAFGAAMTFQTQPPPPDTTAPTVSFTGLSGVVAGTIVVQASAADNVGVTSVQFTLNGVNLGASDTVAPYTVSWNTTTVADGVYTLGATASDAAGNTATTTQQVSVLNTVPPTTPHYLELDGVNDYVDTPDAPALSLGTGVADSPFTVEFWMRPDTMGTKQQVIGKWGDTPTQEYRVAILGGVVRVEMRDASANATVGAYSPTSQLGLAGAWHHVAVTYDGRGGATAANGLTIYIDGVSIALTRLNSAAYVAMENLTGNVQIGRESNGWRQFDGGLDEVRLWNVMRSASEIQANRNSELAGTETGLIAYWSFNEGTGTTSDDRSPNNHVATLRNGVAWVPYVP